MEKGGLAANLSRAGIRRSQSWAQADEMRIGLHGQVRQVWAPRGVKVRQKRQIVYCWEYLALAVDGINGKLRWAWLPNMKKETIAELVAEWKKEGVAALVWDGNGSHKAHIVRQVGMPLISLPPYSPELNPAERVIEAVRAKIEGHVYDSLEDKKARAEAFLRELAACPDRVQSLAGWDWIRSADGELPD